MALNSDSKPKWQPWNEEEFQGDRKVRRLTAVQRWMYRALCQASFFCSTRPYLPDDDDELWLLADCDDKQMWLDNRGAVVQMFSRAERNGVPLLGQKRVLDDWGRIMERREKLSDNGRKGAESRWMTNAIPDMANAKEGQRLAIAPDGNLCEVSKQVSKQESEVREEGEDDMNFQKRKDAGRALTDLSAEILKKVEPSSNYSKALKEVLAVHDRDTVVAAFENWARQQPVPYPYKSPVSSFLRSADKFINEGGGTPLDLSEHADPMDVVHLLDSIALYSNNDVVFNAGQKAVISRLVAVYGPDDVLAGFKDFYFRVDENSKPYAAKDFTEKGEQFIRTRRAAKAIALAQKDFLAKLEAEQTTAAEAEIAASEAAEQAEFESEDIL